MKTSKKMAKALLTSTDFSLTQISEQMGFSSPAYFSQSFRRLPAKARWNTAAKTSLAKSNTQTL